MINKVALIIIYNHQYSQNIDIIEKIYRERFEIIFHLVPFYIGEKENVISVYGNSHYFQGYIAQAYRDLKILNCEHYIFLADDLLLNPRVNQKNYMKYFGLSSKFNFFPGFINLHEVSNWWPRVNEAYHWSIDQKGVEVNNLLPSYTDACKLFERSSLTIRPLSFNQIWKSPVSFKQIIKSLLYGDTLIFRYFRSKVDRKSYSLSFPLVGGYSDIFIIHHQNLTNFCHYCGVFSSLNLFVELAIPTSFVLTTNQIVTEKDLPNKGKLFWSEKEIEQLNCFNYSLNNLIEKFPISTLYIHPIKLSKWKYL